MILRRRGHGRRGKIIVSPQSTAKQYTPVNSNRPIKSNPQPSPNHTKHEWDGSIIENLIVVAYYTVGTPYEKEADTLIKSLNKFKIKHDVVGVPNKGGWQANTRYKATFMLEMLDKHKDYNLLYVDCDAIFYTYPTLFRNYKCDIAVRWQDFRWRKNECLSGTIFMTNNQVNRELCKRWQQINIQEGPNATTFEQWNLGSVIEAMEKEGKLITKNLPPEYTFIFDSMKKIYPDINPVIEHFQASRRYKKLV